MDVYWYKGKYAILDVYWTKHPLWCVWMKSLLNIQNFANDGIYILIMVLKIGPNRPVQPGTGVLSGSILQKNRKLKKNSQKLETNDSTVKTANWHGWTGYGPVLGFPKLTVLKPKTTKSQSQSQSHSLTFTLIGFDLDLRRSLSHTDKRVEVLTSKETRSTLERRKQRQRTSWRCPLKPLFDVTVEVAYKWRSSWREKLDLGSMCMCERETVKV